MRAVKRFSLLALIIAGVGTAFLLTKLTPAGRSRRESSAPRHAGQRRTPQASLSPDSNDTAPTRATAAAALPATSGADDSGVAARVPEPDLPGVTPREIDAAVYAAQADRICRAQDAVMKAWPRYADVRDRLSAELARQYEGLNLPNEKLVSLAVTLRDQFWRAGGNFSADSYQDGYRARLLLEIAHERDPGNLALTDELVETMQAAEVSWKYGQEGGTYQRVRNEELAQALLALRSAQFGQVEKEVQQGREPTWQDFVRTNDLALLLGKQGQFEPAQHVVQWEIEQANRGGWSAYLDPLQRSLGHLSRGDTLQFNIYWARNSSFPEEFKYARRLPSFQGPEPQQRGVTPVHQLSSNVTWKSVTNKDSS